MIGRRGSRWVVAAALAAATVGGTGVARAQDAGQPTSFGDDPGALRLPEAVAVAPDGDVLVGDHFSGRVQRFRDGGLVSSFGLRGEGCGRLGAIGGVAVDQQGNAYVLDTDQQLVQVFDAGGASVRCFGGRGNGLGKLHTASGSYAASSASGGIAVAGASVYVADANNNRVQRFSLTGKDPKIMGKGRLKLPQGLAVQGKRLLVADDGDHRIVELTTSGRYVTATAAKTGVKLRFPYDVAFTASGGAYVADNNLHRVVQLDRHLKRVRAWGTQGHGPGKFVYPRAVAVQRNGHVLVADAGNDRVQEFTATGGYVRTLGLNGRATPRVTQPADVAANGFGEVAVADGNGRISWFTLGGAFQGAWAQSKSFQSSTAVVTQPNAVDFAGDRALRVVDAGEVRELAAGTLRTLFAAGARGQFATSLDVGADGTAWALQPTGVFARVTDPGAPVQWVGPKDQPVRNSAAVARLVDGTIAVTEGTSPHQRDPADGTVGRFDQAGHQLARWAIPRPAGAQGQASRPSGLAATPDGGAWVADTANDRLLRLTPDGAIAQTLDCAGGLLVADAGNNRIVRFPGVATPPPGGCAAAGTPTAKGRPPAPVGLRLKTKHRAKEPGARIASATATCRRTCTLKVTTATIGVIDKDHLKTFTPTATVTGSTIVVKAPAKAVAAMRAALRKGGNVTAGIQVSATAADGVVDQAGVSWTFS
jgi:sugar lactone lactonase YvrE